jgi:hypothetical protein
MSDKPVLKLPRKCFISHSYKDAKARKRLLKNLPRGVEPFVFPPINVSPNDMVSESLIESILDHEGLIYLEGGYSAHSFWVAFERDYALRAGKKVFSFNPETLEIKPHDLPPLELPVFVSHSTSDLEMVNRVLGIMQNDRYFNALSLQLDTSPKTYRDRTYANKLTRMNIVKHMSIGGYLVVFWSKNAAASRRVSIEVEFGFDQSQYYGLDKPTPDFERVLFVLLDNTPLPDKLRQIIQTAPESVVRPVQLYRDGDRSEMHRVDDMIVRLYWLIYRNTQQQNSLE